jgi:hypothetical protein
MITESGSSGTLCISPAGFSYALHLNNTEVCAKEGCDDEAGDARPALFPTRHGPRQSVATLRRSIAGPPRTTCHQLDDHGPQRRYRLARQQPFTIARLSLDDY